MNTLKGLTENNNKELHESVARFEVLGRVGNVQTYCALPDKNRTFSCPVQTSLTASPVEFRVSYDSTGNRIIRIGEHGTSSLLDTIRKVCAACHYNKLKVREK